jgi:hypothetical protein
LHCSGEVPNTVRWLHGPEGKSDVDTCNPNPELFVHKPWRAVPGVMRSPAQWRGAAAEDFLEVVSVSVGWRRAG